MRGACPSPLVPFTDTLSDLDDVIHDIASGVASAINNQGLYEQVAYWAKEGCATVDVIKQELEKAAKEKRENRSS